MLLSGYPKFQKPQSRKDHLLPMIPLLIVSVPALLANFLIPGADYLFFKMESFFFAPIGRALPDIVTIPVVYALYGIIHSVPNWPVWYKESGD